jgi:hypothetical protein
MQGYLRLACPVSGLSGRVCLESDPGSEGELLPAYPRLKMSSPQGVKAPPLSVTWERPASKAGTEPSRVFPPHSRCSIRQALGRLVMTNGRTLVSCNAPVRQIQSSFHGRCEIVAVRCSAGALRGNASHIRPARDLSLGSLHFLFLVTRRI